MEYRYQQGIWVLTEVLDTSDLHTILRSVCRKRHVLDHGPQDERTILAFVGAGRQSVAWAMGCHSGGRFGRFICAVSWLHMNNGVI